MAERALHFGLRSVVCTRQEVQDRETEVEVDVAGGVLYLDDCHLDPAAFMRTLFKATQQMGVKFWLNTEVIGFEKENGKINAVITDKSTISCDEIVMANGSWMGALSAKLGLRVPIQPGKGYSMVYENLEKNLQYPSILVDHRTAATPIDNWLRIGGTMELSGHSDNILPKRVMAIYNAFRKYYPSMKLPTPNPKKSLVRIPTGFSRWITLCGKTSPAKQSIICGWTCHARRQRSSRHGPVDQRNSNPSKTFHRSCSLQA